MEPVLCNVIPWLRLLTKSPTSEIDSVHIVPVCKGTRHRCVHVVIIPSDV